MVVVVAGFSVVVVPGGFSVVVVPGGFSVVVVIGLLVVVYLLIVVVVLGDTHRAQVLAYTCDMYIPVTHNKMMLPFMMSTL